MYQNTTFPRRSHKLLSIDGDQTEKLSNQWKSFSIFSIHIIPIRRDNQISKDTKHFRAQKVNEMHAHFRGACSVFMSKNKNKTDQHSIRKEKQAFFPDFSFLVRDCFRFEWKFIYLAVCVCVCVFTRSKCLQITNFPNEH